MTTYQAVREGENNTVTIDKYAILDEDNVPTPDSFNTYQEAEDVAKGMSKPCAVVEQHYEFTDSDLCWTSTGADTWPPKYTSNREYEVGELIKFDDPEKTFALVVRIDENQGTIVWTEPMQCAEDDEWTLIEAIDFHGPIKHIHQPGTHEWEVVDGKAVKR